MKLDLNAAFVVIVVSVAACVAVISIFAPAQVLNVVAPLLGFVGLGVTQIITFGASQKAIISAASEQTAELQAVHREINSKLTAAMREHGDKRFAEGVEQERIRIKSAGEIKGAAIDKENREAE